MARDRQQPIPIDEDPLWYKDAILYELHVRTYFDSDGDGMGDFRGLTQKLDYLQDLGVTTLWLLPFYPSPLRDDGYDIADYTAVHPAYGTLRDFEVFLREAHRRGMRVVTEMVLNHTSDQHPWFQRARRARPGSARRAFYVWSESPDRYKDARIIFRDFEPSNWTWDPVAGAYYWHRFYAHQPDLNYGNPEVRKAMLHVVDFWMDLGVDGMRLDAVPYLYEREGTSCENLPETHAFLKELRAHVDARVARRMLLAEANQWPEDAVAYFGQGDECHMAFHFPVMPRLFMAIRMEDRFPVIDVLSQTPTIPESCQWALFLRNHDELTLEMVTDEERDYMYRVYANDPQARINLGIRRRLAPLLGNHRRKIELMNGLLFSLPGTPVIYYGDEIGMGDNIYLGDRNAVRTPMQWSADRNAGFSRSNPQRLYLPVIIDPEYHYETVNVEAQQNNVHSLLWWMKRLIALRKRYKAFGRGSLEFLYPDNRKVLAFVRRYQDETILVVANLSRFVQYAYLDLSQFAGLLPVELFGRTPFPPIRQGPYFLTLGPHAFYWFALEPQRVEVAPPPAGVEAVRAPALAVAGGEDALLEGRERAALERVLPDYLAARRWFGGKARGLKAVRVRDVVPLRNGQPPAAFLLLQAEYREGEPETYLLPVTVARGERTRWVRQRVPAVLGRLAAAAGSGASGVAAPGGAGGDDDGAALVYDGLWEPAFCGALLEGFARRRRWRGRGGEVAAFSTRTLRQLMGEETGARLIPSVSQAEQSNTSVIYGGRLILKVFRRVDEGVNPDLEMGRFLAERVEFPYVPPLAGWLEYRPERGEPWTLAVLHGYVPNEGDAWRFTLDELGHYFERVLTLQPGAPPADLPAGPPLAQAGAELPPQGRDLIGHYLEAARLLARRTAEMHRALASPEAAADPAFAPEPFTPLYQRSVYQSIRALGQQAVQLLQAKRDTLPADGGEPGGGAGPEVATATARGDARWLLENQGELARRLRPLTAVKVEAARIRCHGDYHLGQVLYTGKDFVIIDFEGEPARSLGERRLKRSPLRDVAGMLRSFHYAAMAALSGQVVGGVPRPQDMATLAPWAAFWYRAVAGAFLGAYLEAAQGAPFIPGRPEALAALLDAFLLEKALYELSYELNHRPDWVYIPLRGLRELLEPGES